MTTTVVDLHGERGNPATDPALNPDVVYIGDRQHWGRGRTLERHPLYNPHKVRKLGLEEALRRYADRIQNDPDLMAAARALRGRTMACWCIKTRPACHAQIVAAIADGRLERIPVIIAAAAA